MSLAERLGKEIKGDQAVSLLQLELRNLFIVQKSMPATKKQELFHIALRDVKAIAPFAANRDFHFLLRSIPYFAYLKKSGRIRDWLLPEPGSLLTLLWVNKVIVTNDLRAIPVSECLSYHVARKRKKEISELYQKPSNDIVSTLAHGVRDGGLSNDQLMIGKIGRILTQASGLPLPLQ